MHLHREVLSLPVFSGACQGFLKAVAMNTEPVFCAPGEYIIHTADVIHGIYYVSNGSLEILKDATVVAILGPVCSPPRSLSFCNLSNVHCALFAYFQVFNISQTKRNTVMRTCHVYYYSLHKKAVLSQGELCDAAVNFDTYRILQRILRFLCHSTAFLYTSATAQMPKLHTVRRLSRP